MKIIIKTCRVKQQTFLTEVLTIDLVTYFFRFAYYWHGYQWNTQQ